MTAIVQFSALTLVQTLGWTLLHFCWQGALVALLLACALAILPSRLSRLRYAAACAALALMAASPLITFAVLARQTQIPGERFPAPALNQTEILTVSPDQPIEPWTVRCERILTQILPGVVAVWLVGVLILLCRLTLGLMVTRRMRLAAVEPASSELENVLRALKKRMGIERTVRLLNSALVHAPTVIGWLRPLILLPVGCMMALSPSQIEALLAHELAHIRRHDYLVSLFQMVVEALLFYHPAVWWVSNGVRREREHCCDDLAVALSGNRLAYAKALSFLEERRSSSPAGALAATGGVLKTRIARLLGVNTPPVFPRTAAIILLLLAATAAGIVTLGRARAQSAPQQQSAPATPPEAGAAGPKGPYALWLDQEVRWIITPQEKQAYLRLTIDNERQQFIEQFWNRRNPNPGSVVNTFRREHYLRIRYADAHFAVAAEPGWQTDRGHVYIVYGPPDSIDSHPSGANGSAKPFETWHYQSIRIEEPAANGQNSPGSIATRNNIDFRFVDECSCGQYQLQSPWPAAAASAAPHEVPASSGGTASAPSVQILSNIEGQDLNDWSIRWRQQTQSAWLRGIANEPEAGKSGAVTIRFKVLPDGHVTDLLLERRSEDTAVDRAAWAALTESAFPALPSTFHGPYLELRAVFANTVSAGERSQAATQAPDQNPDTDAPQRVHLSAGVAVRQLLDKTPPIYPPIALAAHVSGTVVLAAIISKTGEVENLSYVSGPEMLQRAAMDAVSTWRYKPFLLNSEPVEVETTVNVIFMTQGQPPDGAPAPNTATPPPPPPPPPPPSGQSAGIRVGVHKLTIVSTDLPASEKLQIAQAYEGKSYPIEELKERIRQSLRDLGYAEGRAEIQNPPTELPPPPLLPIDITVNVSAGARYRLSEIRIEGNHAISTDEIFHQFPLHPDDLFNATAIGKGLGGLRDLYVSKGYTKIGIIPRLQMDEVNHTVVLTLNINEGNRASL